MKIILANDGSDNARSAAQFLSQLKLNSPVEIVLVSVIQMPDLHHLIAGEFYRQEFVKAQTAKIENNLKEIEALFESCQAQVSRKILKGHPGETLIELASSEDADLVVMGAVGDSLIDRILLGSTGEYVATNAPCSVLVVRPSSYQSKPNWLLAYDGSEQSVGAFEFASRMGVANEAELQLAQIISLPPDVLTADDMQVVRAELEKDAQNSVQELVVTHPSAERVQSNLIEGSHVGEALCELAEKKFAKALVLGSTGKGMIARMLVGSVSRYVLQHAPCSVLITRSTKQSA